MKMDKEGKGAVLVIMNTLNTAMSPTADVQGILNIGADGHQGKRNSMYWDSTPILLLYYSNSTVEWK